MSKTILMSERILYHKNKERQNQFSNGYITAVDDPKGLRDVLSEKHYKPMQFKHPKGSKERAFAAGYRAAKSDLDK